MNGMIISHRYFKPNSTASGGYTMRKGTKYGFIKTFHNKVADAWKPMKEVSPSDFESVYVIDAMAFVQRYRTLRSEFWSASGEVLTENSNNETNLLFRGSLCW